MPPLLSKGTDCCPGRLQSLESATGLDCHPPLHRLGLRLEHLQSGTDSRSRSGCTSAADDWTLSQVVWIFTVAIATLGLSAAVGRQVA